MIRWLDQLNEPLSNVKPIKSSIITQNRLIVKYLSCPIPTAWLSRCSTCRKHSEKITVKRGPPCNELGWCMYSTETKTSKVKYIYYIYVSLFYIVLNFHLKTVSMFPFYKDFNNKKKPAHSGSRSYRLARFSYGEVLICS